MVVKITLEGAMTVQEVVEALHVHKTTVYRWIDAKKIVALEIGGNLFIPRLEVEKIQEEEKEAVHANSNQGKTTFPVS